MKNLDRFQAEAAKNAFVLWVVIAFNVALGAPIYIAHAGWDAFWTPFTAGFLTCFGLWSLVVIAGYLHARYG